MLHTFPCLKKYHKRTNKVYLKKNFPHAYLSTYLFFPDVGTRSSARSSLPFPSGTYDRCFTFLLWPIWSHFLPIYICFKISVLRPPWIHLDTWYPLLTQNWMNFVKKHDFFHFRPKKGFFEGINRFNPQYFWPIILPNFLGGAIYRPLRT